MWMAFKDPAFARSARSRSHGLARAAYWRALGFPNCARARARQAELREERKRLKEQAAASAPPPVASTTPPPQRKRSRL